MSCCESYSNRYLGRPNARVILGVASVVFGIVFIGDLDAGETSPPWMQGIATFNGIGYDAPATPPAGNQSLAKQATLKSTADRPGYTIPFDPNNAGTVNPYFTPESNPAINSIATVSGELPSMPTPIQDLQPPILPSQPDPNSFEETLNLADDGTSADVAPLETETIRWYQYPARWMKGWNSNAELGIDGSSGNAETLALQTGLEIKRKTDIYTFAIDFDYRQASSRNVTTEDNGRLNTDYDRLIGDTKWSLFAKSGLEWDKFKAFDLRFNVNGGIGYHWIRTDDASFVTRFGAGASKEIGAPDDAWSPEAVFGVDAERQLTPRQKLKGKVDYFPAWENFSDYRLVADASWEVLLDGSDNLSLKVAATDRYDSTPQGARPNDVYYSLLLLYKF